MADLSDLLDDARRWIPEDQLRNAVEYSRETTKNTNYLVDRVCNSVKSLVKLVTISTLVGGAVGLATGNLEQGLLLGAGTGTSTWALFEGLMLITYKHNKEKYSSEDQHNVLNLTQATYAYFVSEKFEFTQGFYAAGGLISAIPLALFTGQVDPLVIGAASMALYSRHSLNQSKELIAKITNYGTSPVYRQVHQHSLPKD